jgi:uncharacterized protein with GYD domain
MFKGANRSRLALLFLAFCRATRGSASRIAFVSAKAYVRVCAFNEGVPLAVSTEGTCQRARQLGEIHMSIYLTRARYTQEAFKGMISQPEDREGIAKAMFDAAGMKLHHIWYSGNGEVICVLEGSAVSGATVGMVVMASGAFDGVDSTELITMSQMVEAMKSAGTVAAKFRPPGK